jgi:hypothetical protein
VKAKRQALAPDQKRELKEWILILLLMMLNPPMPRLRVNLPLTAMKRFLSIEMENPMIAATTMERANLRRRHSLRS